MTEGKIVTVFKTEKEYKHSLTNTFTNEANAAKQLVKMLEFVKEFIKQKGYWLRYRRDRDVTTFSDFLALKQATEWWEREDYYSAVRWQDLDCFTDSSEHLRYRAFRHHCRFDLMKVDQAYTIRKHYYTQTNWLDKDAINDASVYVIRYDYYKHHSWTDFSWYDDPNEYIICAGFKECTTFLINERFFNMLGRYVMCKRTASHKIQQLLPHIPAEVIKLLLFKQIQTKAVRNILEQSLKTRAKEETNGNQERKTKTNFAGSN